MTHKEFFKILVGNPPPEIEFEIEVKQRETEQLPDEAVRAYCLDLVKYTKLQDLLLTSEHPWCRKDPCFGLQPSSQERLGGPQFSH